MKLRLPFRFSPRDTAFLPLAVALGRRAVWIATERCALARADLQVSRVVATVRLPCDSFGGFAVGAGSVWVGESLAGVYRVDPESNRIVARTRIGPAGDRLDVEQIVLAAGNVLARTGEVVRRLHAHVGIALAVAGNHLWTATRDGTIRRLASS